MYYKYSVYNTSHNIHDTICYYLYFIQCQSGIKRKAQHLLRHLITDRQCKRAVFKNRSTMTWYGIVDVRMNTLFFKAFCHSISSSIRNPDDILIIGVTSVCIKRKEFKSINILEARVVSKCQLPSLLQKMINIGELNK